MWAGTRRYCLGNVDSTAGEGLSTPSSVMVRYTDAGVDTPLVLLHLHREYFGEGDGGEGKEVADTAPVVKVSWA